MVNDAINFHVERGGKIILGPAVCYRNDGLSWDDHGTDGWSPCFAAQNRLERDKEHGPIAQGDLIVIQKDLELVYVRRYQFKSPTRSGGLGYRFPPVGKADVPIKGSVGVPVFWDVKEPPTPPILRPDGADMLPQLRDLLEEASQNIRDVTDEGCLSHGRQAKLHAARTGIDTVREYMGG